jgi:hypothetical protein
MEIRTAKDQEQEELVEFERNYAGSQATTEDFN